MKYFVTGIDTDSGKTLASAILCEAIGADYWKPVQAGEPKDSDRVKELISNPNSKIHSEQFILKTPASPHAAAKIDGVSIALTDFKLPVTENKLIVEGAGGCLVPLNDNDFVVDIATHLALPVILVADLYLGSINHTLLSIEALKRRRLSVKGIIFNGDSNPESERIILHHSHLKVLLHINKEEKVDKAIVKKYAHELMKTWDE